MLGLHLACGTCLRRVDVQLSGGSSLWLTATRHFQALKAVLLHLFFAVDLLQELGLHGLECLNVVDLAESVLDTAQVFAVFALLQVA